MYITLEEYSELYEPMDERLFNRFAFDACRVMDIQTTGIDGVKKLKIAFPDDADDATAVKHCAAKMINLLYQIHAAEISAASARGYETTDQGLRGKVISSVSAGNESISYTTRKDNETAIDKAVSDIAFRDSMLAGVVWKSLSGITDANGVNLLYMGRYPCVR